VRRRLFTFCSAVSLLLCVAVCAGWVRSLAHFEIVTVRYERWPRADDHRSTFLGVSWYSNTLRFELICTHRPPAHFALVLRTRTAAETAKWLKEHQAVHPPGLRAAFDGDDVTGVMNGFPPGYAAGHFPYGTGMGATGERWVLSVRPWLPALATALLPAVWVYRFRKTRRARRIGLCTTCGYDLRATPGRCPECGAIPKGVAS
jgi:hypothetical protein